jgi:hypothetical protein
MELDELESGCAMMQVVKPVTRFFVLGLAAALAAAPTLIVTCAIACHSPANESAETQPASAPNCHEAASVPGSPYHLLGHSRGCSHDHGHTGAQVARGDAGTPNKSVHAPIAAVTSVFASLAIRPSFSSAVLVRPPGSGTASSFVLPLRI